VVIVTSLPMLAVPEKGASRYNTLFVSRFGSGVNIVRNNVLSSATVLVGKSGIVHLIVSIVTDRRHLLTIILQIHRMFRLKNRMIDAILR
jgi:hypothetical protein